MSVIIKGMEKPKACIECPFLSKEEYIHVGNGVYHEIMKCTFNKKQDPWRQTFWFCSNVEKCCPIKEVKE